MTIVPRKSDIFETNSRSVPVEYLVDLVFIRIFLRIVLDYSNIVDSRRNTRERKEM